MEKLKIAVGSKNPVKVKAAENAFKRVFGLNLKVVSVPVSSGVSNMPMNFREMLEGAKNRAKRAIEIIDADFGVGIEGGFKKRKIGTFLTSFVAIVDRQGTWGYAQGGGLLMPKIIIRKVKEEKKELGEVMDEIRGIKNTKEKEGCVGFMTNNLIPRQKAFEETIISALSRFIKKEMFE